MSPAPTATAWMPDPVDLERPPPSTAWMPVLVKDLCNPDVVATIAKRRFFDIKDRPNLTREIWEKFRDMLNTVQCSQPVNPNDLEARLRDYHPRLSKSPNPEEAGYPVSGCDTPRLSDEEQTEKHKTEAKEAYDTLIQMGGRPTRPIQFNPRWKKVQLDGELWYGEFEETEVLFYTGFKQSIGLYSTEAMFIVVHWAYECRQFAEELRRWQDFLNTQRWRREHRPEFAREEDIERQRYPQDPDLAACLKKLRDWKEYPNYFQRGIDKCKKQIEGARQAVETLQRNDFEVEKKILKEILQRNDSEVEKKITKGQCLSEVEMKITEGKCDETWLHRIEDKRKWVAAEEKRLEWVKQQLPAVLSECAASLMGAPTSLREMELRSELEAKGVFNALVETGGRPTRPIRPVSDRTDEHLHVLRHWQAEYSQFEEELREWKKFLDYRQKKEADLEEQQRAGTTSQVDLWKDHRAYQQLEVENAKQWVEFWQRQVEQFQNTANRLTLEARAAMADTEAVGTAKRYQRKARNAQSYVEEVRKQVRPAETRLKWVEQQLSALLAEHAGLTTEMSASDPLEDQAKLPKRSSRSGQLKGLQSGRSTRRSNPKLDKNKKHTSANSALGPIHSSKVSKAAKRKTSHPQQPLKILTERDNGQNQGLNITTSPSPPVNVTLHRSHWLSTNQKRSNALEADLAVNLGRNAQPQPIEVMLRRSDRISKQKERMSTSTSNAILSSVAVLQTAPFPRSKPKGRVASTKPDRSWEKPRGISKRGRDLSRKRTKIHT